MIREKIETEKYTLYLGDCLDVLPTIGDESIDLVATSPPYNCRKDYGDVSDERSWSDYYADAKSWIAESYRTLVTGGTIAIVVPGVVRWQSQHRFADTWHDFDLSYKYRKDGVSSCGKGRIEPLGFKLMTMMEECDRHLREPIIWVKGESAINGKYQMGCDSDPYCRPAHEMILLGSKRKWFHRGGTGRRGKDVLPWLDECKDVWFISPNQSRNHPATFPDEIPTRLLRLYVHSEDATILDPFMGSGTTGVACINLGKKFVGVEKSEKYFRIAAKRIAKAAEVPLLFDIAEKEEQRTLFEAHGV